MAHLSLCGTSRPLCQQFSALGPRAIRQTIKLEGKPQRFPSNVTRKQRSEIVCNAQGLHLPTGFLVPDITPQAGIAPAVAESIRQTAFAIPLWELALRTSLEIVLAYAISWAVVKALDMAASKVEQAEKAQERLSRPTSVIGVLLETGLAAMHKPASVLLPLTALVYSFRVVALSFEIVLASKAAFIQANWARWAAEVSLNSLKFLDHFCSDVSSIALVIFTSWFLIAWKDALVANITDAREQAGLKQAEADRILQPVSGLLGWGIVCVSVLLCLQIAGVNIQPFLAVGGISTVAIGFGSQAVVSNTVSGISLFLSRPFVVGDRVELKSSGGGSILVGTVERIDPMRTIFRTDKNIPVTIPNKAIAEMIISNESRVEKLTVFKAPRQLILDIGIRYDDLKKAQKICAEIKEWISTHPGLEKSLPFGAGLAGYGDWSVNLSVLAHTTPAQSRSFGGFKGELMLKIAEILEQNGAEFAYPTSVVQTQALDTPAEEA